VSTFFGSIPAAVILLRRLPVVGAPLSPKPVSISTRLRPVLTITTLNWLMTWSVGRNASPSAFCMSGRVLLTAMLAGVALRTTPSFSVVTSNSPIL
jgi:hypothetical protein